MKAALIVALATLIGMLTPVAAGAETPYGNFEMRIQGRYDFHTWLWAVSRCPGECLRVQAIAQPVAKAFPFRGDAHLVDGRYAMTIDTPDGLRCGNVYYGSVIATRDVYSWNPVTRSGMLTSSFAAGCDGAPGGALTYPFTLVRL